ncbi:ribonuclease E inhibitor RraB [Flavobacterium humi]|uniref:Regulator of ribonuclease activity B domain-containing protein n=1 Tax=Flavobacterium humi TaxID=2562683 RepID=A0A4Z0LD91_9FLAO|nr:ribonuclease E inhibitor RraB [Flavobacterium humi]TGD59882.1 hypothetical protein E4635_02830 [Flavobacterium humi]
MKILHFLKSRQAKPFVSENDFMDNLEKQSHTAIETLVRLRDSDIEEEDKLTIEYCFYTNILKKSEALVTEIEKLNYKVHNCIAPNNKDLFMVSGRTTEIKMMHEALRKWSVEMCELGYKHDCNFDRWEIVLDAN